MLQRRRALVLEAVTRAAGTGALRAAALDHEIWDHAVKSQAVVVSATGQVDEVGDRYRGVFREQPQPDVTLVGADDRADFLYRLIHVSCLLVFFTRG